MSCHRARSRLIASLAQVFEWLSYRKARHDERPPQGQSAASRYLQRVGLESNQADKEIGPMKKRHSGQQIIGFLREGDARLLVKDLYRKHGFSEPSYHA